MTNVKQIPSKLKNHIVRHKAAYVAGAVAVAAIALQQRNRKEFDKFLDEKGIDKTEFYTPDALEETTN